RTCLDASGPSGVRVQERDLLPVGDAHWYQRAFVDELQTTRAGDRNLDAEVVGQVAGGADAVMASSPQQQLAMRVFGGRRRRVQHSGRHDPLGEVVAPLEVRSAAGGGDVAAPEQPLER